MAPVAAAGGTLRAASFSHHQGLAALIAHRLYVQGRAQLDTLLLLQVPLNEWELALSER